MTETLTEALGHGSDAKLLIINCDDLGSSRSANVAVYDSLRNGLATSASLMVPCPWARDAAAMYRGEDVGVHLTLNAEWETYRWGPITHAPSLVDGDGGFPRTIADAWDHADLDEVRRECRTQVERAIVWGFDVSHLDRLVGESEGPESEYIGEEHDREVRDALLAVKKRIGDLGCSKVMKQDLARTQIGELPFR